ncbi:Uncharacterized protein family, basic secretory protein [Cynara cardunculus var. scolymus]|uniref:Uncharacterized protein family, basic secretory protein n=2 Tax=Cynara cardunculus var. scolymus TaxID=59895 RepID=A0A103XG22_CYNCS|nr:Uncharacterized protein family, basic secretory protein [Cynara cardunculus var. scolymus]
MVEVDSQESHEYIISLSPSVFMETSKNDEAIVLAVLHGMARVWLWNGKGATPPVLLNGMVEYISSLAGFTVTQVWKSGGGATMWPPENNEICWKDRDPRRVAGFLRYCDQSKQAAGGGGEVIRRLNQRMSNNWHDGMMDDAIGMAGQHACASYDMMMWQLHPSSSM